jgi:hypothetical protein
MPSDPSSNPPPAHRAKGFRFATEPSDPTVTVLEVDANAGTARIGLDREQLEALSRAAMLAAMKLAP